jgi:hypothetical protein
MQENGVSALDFQLNVSQILKRKTFSYQSRISGSHGGEYEDDMSSRLKRRVVW